MAYINCKVNGYPVRALIGSAAAFSSMSRACAERCKIAPMIDNSQTGIVNAAGGAGRTTGRIQLCQIQVGEDFLVSSFQILDTPLPLDMVLGMDWLRRHGCQIHGRFMRIGATGTEVQFVDGDEDFHFVSCMALAK